MNKQEIRKQIKKILSEIPAAALISQSESICRIITDSQEYKECTCLLAYQPLGDEVDISSIISHTLTCSEKKVFLPYIFPGTNQMEFYRYSKASPTKINSYGIREPEPDTSQSFTCWLSSLKASMLKKEKILVLVPGRAFTRDGKRLGRGKGFYDIYFSKISELIKQEALPVSIKKSGVGFDCQLLSDLPLTPDDILMDNIFSTAAIK